MRGKPRIVPLAIACLMAVTAAAQDAKTQSAESAKATYSRIVAQIQSGQSDVDWKALRLASVQGGVSGNFDERGALSKGWAALNAKKYEDALRIANQAIAYNMANGDAHYLASIAYREMGHQAEFDSEKTKVMAIAHSIEGNNNGKSAESAWFTVTVSEEYFMLRLLGMTPKQQSLTYANGRAYDVMTVTDRQDPGHKYTFWFDTQTSMEALDNVLNGGKKQSQ